MKTNKAPHVGYQSGSRIYQFGGRGFVEFDAEFKLLKSKISMLRVGGGQLTEFDAEFKFAKIQNSHVEGGWESGGGSQNLMLSSNLLKSKIPMLRVGGWLGGGLVEFDAEFKFAKIQNSHVEGGGGGGSWNLMMSPNLLKKKKKFQTKIGTFLFWTLSTKWFPYMKYRQTTKSSATEYYLNGH